MPVEDTPDGNPQPVDISNSGTIVGQVQNSPGGAGNTVTPGPDHHNRSKESVMAEHQSTRIPPKATIVPDVVAFIHERIAWTYHTEAELPPDGDTRYIYGHRHALESILTEMHKAGA